MLAWVPSMTINSKDMPLNQYIFSSLVSCLIHSLVEKNSKDVFCENKIKRNPTTEMMRMIYESSTVKTAAC